MCCGLQEGDKGSGVFLEIGLIGQEKGYSSNGKKSSLEEIVWLRALRISWSQQSQINSRQELYQKYTQKIAYVGNVSR